MNKSTPWAERVLLLTVPILAFLFVPLLGNPFLVKQPLADFLLALSLLLALFQARERLSMPSKPLLYFTALLMVASLLSAWSASNRFLALQDCALEFLFLSLFLTGSCGYFSNESQNRFGQALVFSSFGISLLGIAQWFFPSTLDFDLQALGKMRVFSSLGNPNYVAFYLVLALPLAFHRFQSSSSSRSRILRAILLAVGVLCLLLTESRSGWLALLCAALVGWMVSAQKPKTRWIIGASFLALFAASLYIGFLSHTGRGRFMIWTESFDIWVQHPWGVGWENFNLHQLEAQNRFFKDPSHLALYSQNASFIFDAHNEALNILVETGPLGLLGWLGLVAWAASRGLRKAKESSFNLACYSGWCGTLFFTLWNTCLFYAPLGFPFWMVAGFFVSPGETKYPSPTPVPGGRLVRILGAVPLALILLLSGIWLVKETLAAYWEHQGDIFLSTGPFDRDIDLFHRSLELNPHNGFALQKLGLALYLGGQPEESLEALRKAKPLYGDIAVPYLEAEIMAKQGRYEEALDRYQFIQGAFPNHITPPFMMGQIYENRGDLKKARDQFQRVLDIPESTYNLRLDHEKIRRQKDYAKERLDVLPPVDMLFRH